MPNDETTNNPVRPYSPTSVVDFIQNRPPSPTSIVNFPESDDTSFLGNLFQNSSNSQLTWQERIITVTTREI